MHLAQFKRYCVPNHTVCLTFCCYNTGRPSEQFLEKVKKIKESPKKSQNETELLKKVDLIKGEKTEKKVYKTIKNLFARLNEDVLVIHGLKCMQLKDQNEIEYEEKDFLIINLTKRYVMSLEVKSSLSKNSLKSAKKQVNRAKRVIDEWLGATFTKENGWMFLGVIVVKNRGYSSPAPWSNSSPSMQIFTGARQP